MADQPSRRPIVRPMARCRTCSAWWSVSMDGVTVVDDKPAFTTEKCPCGGELELVDMDKHMSAVTPAPESQCRVKTCGKRWRLALGGLTTCSCGGELELAYDPSKS